MKSIFFQFRFRKIIISKRLHFNRLGKYKIKTLHSKNFSFGPFWHPFLTYFHCYTQSWQLILTFFSCFLVFPRDSLHSLSSVVFVNRWHVDFLHDFLFVTFFIHINFRNDLLLSYKTFVMKVKRNIYILNIGKHIFDGIFSSDKGEAKNVGTGFIVDG